MNLSDIKKRLSQIPIWRGEFSIKPLVGGITNQNFVITDKEKKYVARFGNDLVHHQVLRFHEVAASKAAHAAGIAPKVIYHEIGVQILEYINSSPLTSSEVKNEETLKKIVALLKTVHQKIPFYFKGPAMIFWVFHVIRDYVWTLKENKSPYVIQLDDLNEDLTLFEKASGPFEIVFGHNDLLPANILNDGKSLWLIDWEYAGFNTPLFDLGGLASNNELTDDEENFLLEEYFAKKITSNLKHQYQAMKCASLLRETMWSMVSEVKSSIDFDYINYTKENLDRYQHEKQKFLSIK